MLRVRSLSYAPWYLDFAQFDQTLRVCLHGIPGAADVTSLNVTTIHSFAVRPRSGRTREPPCILV